MSNYPGGLGSEVGKRRSVRQVPRPCAARLRLILCRHGTRRSRTLEQGRTDRARAPAAASAEDLAHLFQAALHGPQGTPRAGPPRRGQAGARRPQPHPCPGSRSGHRAPARMLPRLRPCAAARPAGRDGQHARAHRAAARAAGRGAAPPLGRDLPGLSGACCGPASGRGGVDALRRAAARHGRLPEVLPGALPRRSPQALSYERLQAALSDRFGLTISQGGLMAMLRRAQTRFAPGREAALSALRRAGVVACDETGVRIEGSNSYHWVFRCDDAVVHHAAPTRAGSVVREIMGGHGPAVWLSDRYSAQQGHADRQQTCLAHLARDVAYALEVGDDPVAFRLKLWLGSAFALARGIGSLAASTINAKRRKLEAALDEILAAPVTCDLARDIQTRMRRARGPMRAVSSLSWPRR